MKPLILALALAASLGAGAAPPAINSAYRVTGDAGAAPVQVFDNGREVYVQLRDVSRVPAPFVNGAPATYSIRGPYLILPLIDAFELRLGGAVVRVQRAGVPGGRVAQVYSAVDALAQPEPAPQPALPVSVRSQTLPAPQAPAPGRIVGEIALESEPVRLPAPSSATSSMRPGSTSISHVTPANRTMFESFRGKRVMVTADGTVAGARHAERLRAVCTVAGPSACSIRYRGAAAGTSTLETL